jgi:hypothetical protein
VKRIIRLGLCTLTGTLLFTHLAADSLPPDATYRALLTLPFNATKAIDEAAKPAVLARQRALLGQRYDLSDRPMQGVMMSAGHKAVQAGVRVKLPGGVSWESLGSMSPENIKQHNLLPPGFYHCHTSSKHLAAKYFRTRR